MGQARRRQAEIQALIEQARQATQPGYVYAINTRERFGLLKLGLAVNPQRRLRELQTGNPDELMLMWSHPVLTMAATERLLHRVFDRYLVRGEWYDLGPLRTPTTFNAIMVGVFSDLLERPDPRIAGVGNRVRQAAADPERMFQMIKVMESVGTCDCPDCGRYNHERHGI